MKFVSFVVVFLCFYGLTRAYLDEEEEKLPTKCHVCKHMTREMSEELGRSGKSHDVLYLGQVFQKDPKKVDYRRSELRLTEALEDACSNVLEYKVHKDKPLSLRYEKVESTTFKTLKGLKKRGVKVDLGFPDQMWDTPDAEVTRLKNRCEFMVEQYEDDITQWYWHQPDENLTKWLCIERVLEPDETDCLNEGAEENDSADTGKENMTDKKDDESINTAKKKAQIATNKKGKVKEKEETKLEKKKQCKKKAQNKKSKKNKRNERQSRINEKESDSEKIRRLIREQSEQQAKGGIRNAKGGRINEMKRKMLQRRLEIITDTKALRREIRKIRKHELSEEEYFPEAPWENELTVDKYPADVIRSMRQHVYDRIENAEDFRHELDSRQLHFGRHSDFRDDGSMVWRLREEYLDEARNIRDPEQFRGRLQDLDALSAIFDKGRGRHDEL